MCPIAIFAILVPVEECGIKARDPTDRCQFISWEPSSRLQQFAAAGANGDEEAGMPAADSEGE